MALRLLFDNISIRLRRRLPQPQCQPLIHVGCRRGDTGVAVWSIGGGVGGGGGGRDQ